METSFKEKRVRDIVNLYYSKPEIQKAIYDFSKNREISPRYFDGFGKRPDSFQYPNDIFEMAKKGATSFHCSEELWQDPLKIVTGMNALQLNEIRIGWDLLIDIDCPYFDYSKKAAQAIISVFEEHGIKNIGLKFSGSKGFHILLPWKAFPKQIAGEETKNLFPELPRKLVSYIRFKSEEKMKEILPEDFYKQFENSKIKKGIKCNSCKELANEYQQVIHFCPKCSRKEYRKLIPDDKKVYKCPDCRAEFNVLDSKTIFECRKCNITSEKNPTNFSRNVEVDLFDLMGLDLVLVSPRHLFRMPYSLHEKTALASIVLDKNQLKDFDLKNANPLKVSVKNFMPDSIENEAEKLVREALDWCKEHEIKQGNQSEKVSGKYSDFKPIILKNITDNQFPPCVKKILKGVSDGRKRSLFVLLNLFRSIGMDREELEKKIYEWNKKNEVPLKEGYIISQLKWSYSRKPIMPQNCREFYQGIGVCQPDNLCNSIKNPVNYTIRKNFNSNKK